MKKIYHRFLLFFAIAVIYCIARFAIDLITIANGSIINALMAVFHGFMIILFSMFGVVTYTSTKHYS